MIVMCKEKRSFKLKFKHSLLHELHEERAKIYAKFLQSVLHSFGQERLQEHKRRQLYDSERKKVLQNLLHELQAIFLKFCIVNEI